MNNSEEKQEIKEEKSEVKQILPIEQEQSYLDDDLEQKLLQLDYNLGKKIISEISSICEIFFHAENLTTSFPDNAISREPVDYIGEIVYLLKGLDLM